MTFGNKLKTLRTEKGMTQEHLGEKLQVSRSTISSWETSRSYPDLQMIVVICDLLETSLDELLREDVAIVKKLSFDTKAKKILMWMALLAVLLVGNQVLSSITFKANPKQIEVTEMNIVRDRGYHGGDADRDWNTTIDSRLISKNPFFKAITEDFLLAKKDDKLIGTVYGSFNFFHLFTTNTTSITQSVLLEKETKNDELVIFLNGQAVDPKIMTISEINIQK
ncbi:helix-turn-helix transcriptional regulator [Enterococcus sp.]|uniref:helix-turn-helix transcriptional regulator n=1 Tax=Enterococcus sp. TaxID=35783 RepID=UPI002FC9BB49